MDLAGNKFDVLSLLLVEGYSIVVAVCVFGVVSSTILKIESVVSQRQRLPRIIYAEGDGSSNQGESGKVSKSFRFRLSTGYFALPRRARLTCGALAIGCISQLVSAITVILEYVVDVSSGTFQAIQIATLCVQFIVGIAISYSVRSLVTSATGSDSDSDKKKTVSLSENQLVGETNGPPPSCDPTHDQPVIVNDFRQEHKLDGRYCKKVCAIDVVATTGFDQAGIDSAQRYHERQIHAPNPYSFSDHDARQKIASGCVNRPVNVPPESPPISDPTHKERVIANQVRQTEPYLDDVKGRKVSAVDVVAAAGFDPAGIDSAQRYYERQIHAPNSYSLTDARM